MSYRTQFTFVLISIVFWGQASASELHRAITARDVAALQAALQNGGSPDAVDLMSGGALHLAANLGWTEGVRLLVKAGADPFLDDASGTAMAAAAAADRPEVLKVFSDLSVDILDAPSTGAS